MQFQPGRLRQFAVPIAGCAVVCSTISCLLASPPTDNATGEPMSRWGIVGLLLLICVVLASAFAFFAMSGGSAL